MAVVAMTVLVVATTLLIKARLGPARRGVALLVVAPRSSPRSGISTLVISFATQRGGGRRTRLRRSRSRWASSAGRSRPARQAPEAFATLSLFTPHGWFLRGLGELHGAGGGSPRDCLPRWACCWLIGLVTGAIGVLPAPDGLVRGRVSRASRKALEIGRINLLRQFRDRSDLFFVFVLPTLIIVALGLQFGGATGARLGVVYARRRCRGRRRCVAAIAADDARFDDPDRRRRGHAALARSSAASWRRAS